MEEDAAGTLSMDPCELGKRAESAENCATESGKLTADHAAEGISGKIRGGTASSAVKTAAGCLTGKLKSIEGTLNEHSSSLLQTARDVEQTDQTEAGAYAGFAAFGDSEDDAGMDCVGASASAAGGEGGVSATLASIAPGASGLDEGEKAADGALAGIYELMGAEPSEGWQPNFERLKGEEPTSRDN